MSPASYLFLLLFLPVTLGLYWLACRTARAKLVLLCAVSLLFYALGGLVFLPLLVGLSLATYGLARIQRTTLGVILNLGALLLFKYWNFGAENVNALTHSISLPAFAPLLMLALPLGLSFYTFRHIGYLLDVRGNRYLPTSDFLAFLTFSAFYPQISAGPISSFEDTGTQLRNLPARLSGEAAQTGLLHISLGLIKKLLIADTLANALSGGMNTGDGVLWAWTTVVLYALQLYFDFSGYTDLVLGVSYLFGVALPPNFNNPYLATSPSQFWTRWHMSLSNWFRFYLFLPLSRTLLRRWGMARKEAAQYASNFITMGLIGLWHGAGWGFVLWGLYHGLMLNLYAWANHRRIRLEGHVLLLLIVLLGWALFLSPDLGYAANLFRSLFGLNGLGEFDKLSSIYNTSTLLVASIAVLLTASGRVEAANLPTDRRYAWVFGALAALALLHLSGAARFIYVQF
jgi:alginate O-acetyltransferase complex protein AlgI